MRRIVCGAILTIGTNGKTGRYRLARRVSFFLPATGMGTRLAADAARGFIPGPGYDALTSSARRPRDALYTPLLLLAPDGVKRPASSLG